MPNETEAAPVADPNIDQLVGLYVDVRDWIRNTEARHKKELASKKLVLQRIEGHLQKFLDTTKQNGGSCKSGTFFKTIKYTASIEDRPEFRHFVIGGEHWDLLDWKANAPAVRDFTEENKALPPGVKLTPKEDVNVRRPTEK